MFPAFRSLPVLGLVGALLVSGAPLLAQAKPPVKAAPKAKAAVAPAAPVKGVTVEGITEYRLANGLRVLLFPDASKPTLTVNVTYLVGSIHENYGETGMAHLLEHLVFKPTKKYSGENGTKTPVQILNGLGARFNGSTFLDRTNYFISFPAQGDNLKTILELEADRMVNSPILQKDLWDAEAKKGEMTVVRNEFEMGENNPLRITMQRTLSTAFDWHNYGKSTIGARTDIENVSIDRLRAFYHTYYQPDNAVLLVAGKFEEAAALKLINDTLGRLPKPTRTLQKTYTLDPTQDGERSVTVRRVGDVQMLMAAYKVPAGSDPQFAAVEVLGQVMADEGSGRLYKALVDAKKAQFVFPYVMAAKEPGFALFGAQLPKEVNLEEAKATFLKALEGVKGQPLTAEEVEKAKRTILKEYELTLNDSGRLGVGMSEYIAQGDWRLFFLQRDRVAAVKTEEVQKAAETYLRASNRTLGEFIPEAKPERAEIPAPLDVAAMVKDYKGRTAVVQGEAFEATPANIDARTQRFALPSGMKVAFLPKKTRGEMVSLALTLHLGDEASLMKKDGAGEMAAQMLMRGTERLNKEQLKEAFDKLKAEVMVGGNAEQVVARVNTTKANLPEVVKLLAEVLQKPALAQVEFDRAINEAVTGLESQKSEPDALAQTAITKHMKPYPVGHVKATQSPEEAIAGMKALKLEEVQAFHKAFYGASLAELALVGDFDPAAEKAQIAELFGAWKPATAPARIPGKNFAAPAIDKAIETPDKANGFFMAMQELSLKDSDPDYPALMMANQMLGGGMLKSRLADRIRQKEGLSYGVGSQLQVSPFDAVGAWVAYAIYNPGNIERLQAAFKEELARALKDGFTAEELKDAQKAWLQSQAQGRTQDRELAARLAGQLWTGRTMAFNAELEAKVQALGVDQVNAALKKYLDPAKISIVKAGDFAKAKAAAK